MYLSLISTLVTQSPCAHEITGQRFHQNRNSMIHEVPAHNFSIPGHSLQQKAKGECILMDETVAGKAGDTSKLLFPVLKRGHQE